MSRIEQCKTEKRNRAGNGLHINLHLAKINFHFVPTEPFRRQPRRHQDRTLVQRRK